jgi:chemotaxis protein CheZ
MTEQAASRVLNATDIAKPIQERVQREGEGLSERWEKLFVGHLSIEEFKELAMDTRALLKRLPEETRATNAQLTEIMMAQDFQDLTGQVIKKMMEVIREIEHQLVQVLIDCVPEGAEQAVLKRLAEAEWEPEDEKKSLLNGPQIKPTPGDAVANQDQVDDLLAQLGF